MIAFLIFAIFFLIHTYVFMYQRTTLTIARAMGNVPIMQVQTILTPNWMGLLGWISTFGLYGSYILIWLQVGWLWAIGLFILNHLSSAVIPIPSKYFYNIVEKHLVEEIKRQKGKEERGELIILSAQIKQIMEKYRVS